MGAHTAEILSELGYDQNTITALSEAAVITEADENLDR